MQTKTINLNNQILEHFNNTQEIKLREIVHAIPKNGKVNPDIIYKSLLLSTSSSDTSKVNINKYGKLNYKLNPIGSIFCDNIVLVAFTPIECVKIKANGVLDNGNIHLPNQREGILNVLKLKGTVIIPGKVKPLRVTYVDGKNNHFVKPPMEDILKIYKKYNVEYDKDKSYVVGQYLKIELSQLDYKDVLKLFNKDVLEELYNNCFVKVADIDFTMDYGGSFCKKLMWQYFLKQGFREQQDSDKNQDINIEQIEEDEDLIIDNIFNNLQDNDNKILLKNNTSVGSNCLSYLKGDKRCKMYSKFVHSLEVKNNVQQVGNNISNWCNNPEKRLNETIDQTLKTGLTRLEITFYRNKQNGQMPLESEILYELKEFIELIPADIIYNTSIKKQWRAFTEVIKDNVLLVDLTNNNALLAYSINKQTNRVSGIKHKTQEKDKTKNKKEGKEAVSTPLDITDVLYLLTHCTYNVPIVFMFINIDIRQEEITTYKKNKDPVITTINEPYITISYNVISCNPIEGDKLTYIFNPGSIYYSKEKLISDTTNANNPEDRGLTDRDNAKLRIKDINDKRFYKTKKYKFGDHYFTLNVETYKDFIFKKPTTAKQLLLEDIENNFNIDNIDTITDINNYNKDNLKDLIEKQQLEETKESRYRKILNTLETVPPKNLITLNKDYTVKVNAIKEYVEGYGPYAKNKYILITTKNLCFNATPLINTLINKCLINKTFVKGKYDLITAGKTIILFYFTITDNPLMYKGVLYPTISPIEIKPDIKEINEQDKHITDKINSLSEIELNNLLITDIFKIKNCINIDELSEKEIITVTAIKKRGIGKLIKYILYTEEYPKIAYVSNPSLQTTLNLYDITQIKTKFKILIGPHITTKTKNKCRRITVQDMDILTGTIKEIKEIKKVVLTEQEPQPEPPTQEPQTETDTTQEPIIKIKKAKKIKEVLIKEDLPINIKMLEKHTYKLENLPPGDIKLTITEIKQKENGTKIKYLFKTLEYPNVIFISNMHMEDILLKVSISKIKIIIVSNLKTTRNKIKQRLIKLES